MTDAPLEPTASFELVAPAFRAARHLGRTDGELSKAAGFALHAGLGPGARVTVGELHAVWTAAARVTRDPGFGLVASALVQQGDMDLLDYVFRGSPTLRFACDKMRRFWRLAHDCVGIELAHDRRRRLVVEFHVEDGLDVPAVFVEWGVGAWARVTREIFGPVKYHEVRFRHGAQVAIDRYEGLFGCRPRFHAARDALVMGADVLDHVNPAADPRLVDVLERYAEARLREMPDRATLSSRVKGVLHKALPEGDLSIQAVARGLKMSERTLRRRLEREGTSHRDLLDALRRELALRYLGDQRLSVQETSFRLGFDCTSGLHRAFKRWTGVSPVEYRARNGAG